MHYQHSASFRSRLNSKNMIGIVYALILYHNELEYRTILEVDSRPILKVIINDEDL